MTFWPAHKAMRSIAAGQNVGGVWRGNGAQRNDLAGRNPGAPEGRGTHTDLLGDVGPDPFLLLFLSHVKIFYSFILLLCFDLFKKCFTKYFFYFNFYFIEISLQTNRYNLFYIQEYKLPNEKICDCVYGKMLYLYLCRKLSLADKIFETRT
jgi:hypothetical protein